MYNHVFHNAVTINWNNILLRENNISQSKNDIYRKAETIYLDCSQSPIFSLDRRCRSLSPTGRHLGLLMQLERVQNAHGGHSRREKYFFRSLTPTLLTPSPLPTGISYSPQFRSHQETKMAARRTQRSTSMISRKNRGL